MKFRGMCFCSACEAGHARYFSLKREVGQLLVRAALLGQEGHAEAARALVTRATDLELERSRISLLVLHGHCLREESPRA